MHNRPVTLAWKIMVSLGIFPRLSHQTLLKICVNYDTNDKDLFDKNYGKFFSLIKDEFVYVHKYFTCS